MLRGRDARGLIAQLLAIALTAAVAMPLLAAHPGELAGAQPRRPAMMLGAFVFGGAMQVVIGCGSGTLVNAGSGNVIGLVALPLLRAGSLLGTPHLDAWSALGTCRCSAAGPSSGPPVRCSPSPSPASPRWRRALRRGARRHACRPPRMLAAALLLAALRVANLVVAGQPWGVVYGLGLWGAKAAPALGLRPPASPSGRPGQRRRA